MATNKKSIKELNKSNLPDTQGQEDTRNLPINKVGIKDILHPMMIKQRSGKTQTTVANFNMYVNLPHNLKGTHMSRFVHILNNHEELITVDTFKKMIEEMLTLLEAESGHVEMTFPYFINKTAPTSKVQSLLDYTVTFIGEIENGISDLKVKVLVPGTSLCPCSKKISPPKLTSAEIVSGWIGDLRSFGSLDFRAEIITFLFMLLIKFYL